MELRGETNVIEPARIRRKTSQLLLIAAPLILVLAACGSSQAASGGDTGRGTTVEKDGIQMTISPSTGPVGTAVDVTIAGVPKNTGYGVVSFKDGTGAFGEDELTSDYVVDTRIVGEGGSLHLVYKIPANVLVSASPDAQNPTAKTPTSGGPGNIVLSVSNVELEAPFTVAGDP